jgi:hypothetical protein
MSGQKIADGLRDAVSGNMASHHRRADVRPGKERTGIHYAH